jgi:hypothetical protein
MSGKVTVFEKIVDAIFGCHHSNISFPMTIRDASRRPAGAQMGMYVVCLDCGREFSYDWQQMRIAAEPSTQSPRSLITKEAA